MDSLSAVGGQVEPGDFVDIIVQSNFTPPVLDDTGLDVFQSAAQDSVYTSPARFLYRGVRILGVNDDFVGQEEPPPGEVVIEEEDTGVLQLTFALPADSSQKILSVSTSDLVLALLPEDFDPANPDNGAIPNQIPELIQFGEDLPGENPDELTPYGPLGFIEVLTDDTTEAGVDAGAAGEADTAVTDLFDGDAEDAPDTDEEG